MHVTLVPYIKAAHELKTKPTQQSVAKLREIGLQPQVLICRTENPLDRDVRQKLSLFCSVSEKAVIEARDVEHTVYEYPLMLHAERLDELVCDLLHLKTPEPDLADWRNFVERVVSPKKRVKITIVGKYIDLQDAYKSIYESLTHAAASQDCGIDLKLVDAESLQDGIDNQLKDVAGVLIPGGFGERGVEGKSRPPGSLANTKCRISVCASACKWQQLNSRETSVESKTRTALNSTKTLRSQSSRCSRSSVVCAIKALACALAHGRQKLLPARLPKKSMAKPMCSSDTATVTSST
jgi:hypothetical protein